eukprot:8908242-Lingulodinium_polyedra.AAC.1
MWMTTPTKLGTHCWDQLNNLRPLAMRCIYSIQTPARAAPTPSPSCNCATRTMARLVVDGDNELHV